MRYLRFYNPYMNAYRDEHETAMTPAANIFEADNEYRIEMALPGVDKKDIQIKYEKGLLTIRVEKDQENENGSKFDRREFNYKGSERTFKTGDKVNTDLITAKYENGVLTLSLPKKEAFVQKPVKSIQVV